MSLPVKSSRVATSSLCSQLNSASMVQPRAISLNVLHLQYFIRFEVMYICLKGMPYVSKGKESGVGRECEGIDNVNSFVRYHLHTSK